MITFPKLLLLVAVIAIIWFGFRWFERWEKERRAGGGGRQGQLGRGGDAGMKSARGREATPEEMTACPICGTYVAAGAGSCGRANCPFPRS
ncbi:MAG TPA: hypothetical protein VGB82_22740 [Alphaproteobacteria bacterium]